jgi:hypothetical protein
MNEKNVSMAYEPTIFTFIGNLDPKASNNTWNNMSGKNITIGIVNCGSYGVSLYYSFFSFIVPRL